jgi:hypothetical protein
MINKKDLKLGYTIYGAKGNVWNNTAHIYQSGKGNLCGTPALATNHAQHSGLEEAGCVRCNEIYSTIK